MPLADDQNMIKALTPKRSDQAFSVWVHRFDTEGSFCIKRGAHLARENRLGPFGQATDDHLIESKNPIRRTRISASSAARVIPILRLSDLRLPNRGGRWT